MLKRKRGRAKALPYIPLSWTNLKCMTLAALGMMVGAWAPQAHGQVKAKAKPNAVRTIEPADLAAHAFEAARGNPLELRTFLVRMPKGADLHVHLSGAVYAESWIRAGAEDNLCVDLTTLSFFKTEAMTKSMPGRPVCGEGRVPAATALKDQALYDNLIDAFSMRSFVASAGV